MYLAVAGQDTLRDDGLLFKQKLDALKYVKVHYEREAALTTTELPPSLISMKDTRITTGRGHRPNWMNHARSLTRMSR